MKTSSVRKMVTMAILAAISIVLVMYTRFPIIPAAPYLMYEAADVPILLGGFVYGPVAGLIITIIAAFIQAITFDAGSGWVGFVMHVIATGTLVTVASLIYKKFHTFKGAILALISGCLAMTLIMIPTNLVITTNFWGMPLEVVQGMIVPILIPFNLIKSVANSVLVLLVYKTLRRVVK